MNLSIVPDEGGALEILGSLFVDGDGDDSQQVETAIKDFYKRLLSRSMETNLQGIQLFMVNESGTSVYSASDSAREEFPDLDLTFRGAVSIGRRLIDPLSKKAPDFSCKSRLRAASWSGQRINGRGRPSHILHLQEGPGDRSCRGRIALFADFDGPFNLTYVDGIYLIKNYSQEKNHFFINGTWYGDYIRMSFANTMLGVLYWDWRQRFICPRE